MEAMLNNTHSLKRYISKTKTYPLPNHNSNEDMDRYFPQAQPPTEQIPGNQKYHQYLHYIKIIRASLSLTCTSRLICSFRLLTRQEKVTSTPENLPRKEKEKYHPNRPPSYPHPQTKRNILSMMTKAPHRGKYRIIRQGSDSTASAVTSHLRCYQVHNPMKLSLLQLYSSLNR